MENQNPNPNPNPNAALNADDEIHMPTRQPVDYEGQIMRSENKEETRLNIFADWLVKDSGMTPEQAAAAVRKTEPVENVASIQNPPAASFDYTFPHVASDKYTADAQKFESTQRDWLTEGQFTRDMGNSVISEIDQVQKTIAPMSEAQRAGWKSDQHRQLQAMWGDKTDEKIKAAGDFLRSIEAKKPGVLQFIGSSGAGDSALVISMLYGQSQLLAAKKAK